MKLTMNFYIMCAFILAVFFALYGCNNLGLPNSADPTPEVTIENQAPEGSTAGPSVSPVLPDIRGCEVLDVRQRRAAPNSNRVVLEVHVDPRVTGRRIKFIGEGDTEIKRVKDFPIGEVFEVRLDLKCGSPHRVRVWVEGFIEGKLYQCDGSVTMEFECEPECTTCECRGDCPPPCTKPTYSGFYGCKTTVERNFIVSAGYTSLRGDGDFDLTLRRHLCNQTQVSLGTVAACHPTEWSDSASLDCFEQGTLGFKFKQSRSYNLWCYTMELSLDGAVVETRPIPWCR